MEQRRAIIIGGGIAGLSAGIALRKAGYAVTLYEQAEALVPMGAALSLWGNAMAGLDWLGCGDAVRAQAARVEQLSLRDTKGRALFGPVDIGDSDSYLALRTDLQTTLLETLGAGNVVLDTPVGAARQSGDAVWVEDAHGQALAEADLLVVADGIHSSLATALLGNVPNYSGYGGFLALADTPPQARGCGEEIWGDDERFGLFDGGGAGYWFYMRGGCEAEIAAMDHDALTIRAASFPARISEAIAATPSDRLIHVSIHARAMPRSFGRGRIICIGDAAHAMEPNQGQGACQGIEDAWVLGVLAQRCPPDAILPEFDRLRMKRVRRAHRDSALIGRIAHGSPAVRRAVSAAFRTVPRALDARQLKARIAPPHHH